MNKKQFKNSYNRILKVSEDAQQITLPDARYYKRNGEFYPSVTYVLSYFPKGKHFEEWLKKVGYSADYIVRKAGQEGTQVHELIEDYLEYKEITFLNEYGHPKFAPHVWEMFNRFVEWWNLYKPKLIESEVHLFSDRLKIAGTCDMVCEIEIDGKKELWIIDFKTSNNLHTSYELQTSIYGECYKECFGKTPDRYGILWLKAKTRGPSKNKMQGKGWSMFESKRKQEENIEIYETVRKLFDLENPNPTPQIKSFENTIKRTF